MDKKWLFLFFILSIFLSIIDVHAAIVFKIGVSGQNFLTTQNVSIFGGMWDGTTASNATTVNITITNTTSFSDLQAITDVNGTFYLSYNVSNLALGQHNVSVSYSGTNSNTVSFTVTNVAGAVGIIASNVYAHNFTGYQFNPGWNTTPLFINSSNISSESFPYFILLENVSSNVGTYQCERAFVSTSNNFTLSNETVKAKYLREGNFFRVNNTDYFVIYISPQCNLINIIKPSNFTFTGGEEVKIIATPIDPNRVRIPVEDLPGGTALFEVYHHNGTRVNSTNVGNEIWHYRIPNSAGRYFMFLAGHSIGSFSVEVFTLKAEVLDETDSPVFVIKPNDNIKIATDLINASTSKTISSGATVTAEYTNASETSGKTNYSLSYDSSLGRWVTQSHAGPDSGQTRNYKITATVSGDTQVASADVVAKPFEIMTIPLSKEKGEGEGFAPNTPAVMVVAVRNMTDGTLLDLTDFTNNCANTTVRLNVTDSSGNDVLSVFSFSPDSNANGLRYYNYNLTHFFTNIITDAPTGVVDEFKQNFGERSCMIVFQTPNQEGSFNTIVSVNISNTIGTSYNSFLIQTIFVRGEPASDYRSGIWYFTPGSKVTMIIKARTPDGTELDASNITEASLVEVVTEDGTVVTDSMLNETFSNVTTIASRSYATLSFVANDSVMGFHRVGFRIKALVGGSQKESDGDGWFVEKKYHIFAYPQTSGREWFFSANDNITLIVQVMDEQTIQSMGFMGGGNQSSSNENIQSVSVTVDEIRSAEDWAKVTNWQAGSGTTDGQGRTNLIINQTSAWSSGGYAVKIKATKSGVTDFGFGWFEIRNFNFWAYSQDWRIGTNQSINITLQSYASNWQPINATVRLTGIIYHGGSSSWVNIPVSFNTSAEWLTVNTTYGQGTLQIPAGIILKSGFYEAVLNATYGSSSQTSRVFFETIAFVIVTQKDKWEWDAFYSPGDIVNITVSAGKKKTWTWPPNVTDPVNISKAWIDDLHQEGMFDPLMKKGDVRETSLGLSTTTNCNGMTSTCNVWFNTSQLTAGRYFFQVVVNDTSNNQANEFEFLQIKTFDIKSPELKLIQIPTTSSYKYTNASAIQTDKTWKSCSDTQLSKPSSITNCKAIDNYKFTDNTSETGMSILIDFGNSRIYIDDRNSTLDFDFTTQNATNSSVNPNTNKTVGENFTIGGITYKIISIGDTVTLQSTNAVFRDSNGNGKIDTINTDWDSGGDALALYFVSDTTKDYFAAFADLTNWNSMRDDDWLGIDLDGDDNTWEDAWHLILKTQNNLVQNVYIANETNLTKSEQFVKTYPGTTPANFTPAGTPIYFVGAAYSERTGSSGYEVRFTSNKTGWGGMNLGTFGNNVNVSIPVMVIGATRLSGANVSISKVVPLGSGQPAEQNPTVITSVTADANGIAVIQFNTSWLGSNNGMYALKFSANHSGRSGESTGMPWEWPVIERRDFRLRIQPGTFGNVFVRELSTSAGNLENYTLYESTGQKLGNMNSFCGDGAYNRVDDFRYNRLIMNLTENQTYVFVANEGEDTCNWNTIKTRPAYAAGQTIAIQRDGWTEFINLTRIVRGGIDNVTLNWTAGQTSFNGWGVFINLTDFNLTSPQTLKLNCKFLEWNWEILGPDWQGEGASVCSGMFTVHFTGGGGVNLTIQPWVLTLDNPWNLSLGGEWKVIKVANVSNGYELVYYDDASVTNADNWVGKNVAQNRPDGYTFADRVLLINATTGIPINYYYLGQPIPELNNKVVFGGFIWESKIFLTNETQAPYPLPWTCDGYNSKFYFGNFSESDVQVDLNAQWFDPFNPPRPNASEYYSIMLFDNECDGVGAISGGYYDDDPELWDRIACPGGGSSSSGACTPQEEDQFKIDFYGTSGKADQAPSEIIRSAPSDQWQQYQNMEKWFRLGEDNWPIIFVNDTILSNGNISTFRETENFNRSEDVTYLIKARRLDGSFVSGNASVYSVFDFMNFIPITPPTDNVTLTTGQGVLKLNSFTNRTGSYMVSVRVCDTILNACETMERSVFIGSMQDVYKMGEGGSGGGGGGEGGEIP